MLLLRRSIFSERTTSGDLYLDGIWECYTLEDRRGDYGKGCAIPPGRYEIIVNWSERFRRRLPLLLMVPGRTGIRIHAGNTEADTEGCILVGRQREPDRVLTSRPALEALQAKIVDALQRERLWLTVEEVGPPEGPAD